jgi:hypothetical protein
MSAAASGRELASPDSRRRRGARRSQSEPPSRLGGSRGSAPGTPAGGTHRVPDAPNTAMPQQLQPTETFTNQLARLERARRGRLRSLWQMNVAERIAAMRRGELTLEQLAAWSARHPDQVPVVNGEFEWIATRTPEACE